MVALIGPTQGESRMFAQLFTPIAGTLRNNPLGSAQSLAVE
jgi:hypothetical protein